ASILASMLGAPSSTAPAAAAVATTEVDPAAAQDTGAPADAGPAVPAVTAGSDAIAAELAGLRAEVAALRESLAARGPD
ncbi:MAG: hypothetical protein MUE82_12565, partial [Chloroflexi bacterium]|nr:hypothetical protein [Chloroflexota bacterium]